MTKHLLKLGPKTQSLEFIEGSADALTPADVAGALGGVSTELRRQLLALLWWPEGFRPRIAYPILIKRLIERWQRQQHKITAMQTEQRVASNTGDFVSALAIHIRIEEARDAAWPDPGETKYRRLVQAVLEELVHADICLTCNGQGKMVIEDGKIVKCPACKTRGRNLTRYSNGARAKAMKISRPVYQRNWSSVYEYLLNYTRTELQSAEQEIRRALQ